MKEIQNNIETPTPQGMVYLVGAGPGDPELITVKGANVLKRADVIVYDRLANTELLALASDKSEHIYVGKRPDKPSVSQEQINHILVTKAYEGKQVARLKGGDPFVFGRGGEECEALRAEKVPYEIVPGLSSALTAPAFAGIPATHRKVARSFTVVTGHTIKRSDDFENWEHLALADTLVVLMGMRNLSKIVDKLINYGRDRNTPAAVVEKATYEEQQVATGTLSNIAEEAKGLSSPGTIIIGKVAAKSDRLAWFQQDNQNKTIDSSSLDDEWVGSRSGLEKTAYGTHMSTQKNKTEPQKVTANG